MLGISAEWSWQTEQLEESAPRLLLSDVPLCQIDRKNTGPDGQLCDAVLPIGPRTILWGPASSGHRPTSYQEAVSPINPGRVKNINHEGVHRAERFVVVDANAPDEHERLIKKHLGKRLR